MKLEQQVASLELCKKLKELGVKQESLWYWEHWFDAPGKNIVREKYALNTFYPEDMDICSAFTVAELGEMLPYCLGAKKRIRVEEYFIEMSKLALGWWLKYQNGKKALWAVTGNTEADARAKMLIYLLEQKLITL